MQRFEAPVLRAVAYPPTMIFVPLPLAGMNIGANLIGMMIGIVVFGMNPIWWMLTSAAGHVLLLTWSQKEPHAVNMLRAKYSIRRWGGGSFASASKNIVPAEWCKYVP